MKTRFLLVASLIFIILTSISIYAVDNVIVNFPVSTSATVEATGFRTQVAVESSIEMVAVPQNEGGGNAIKMTRNKSITSDNVLWKNGWADKTGNRFAITTRIKTDEVDNPATHKQIRTNTPINYLLQIKGTELYSCGNLVSDFTVEAGKWYDVTLAVRKDYLDLYIDGTKVAINSVNTSSLVATSQFRIEINNIGTFYVGDTKIFKPEVPTFEIDNPALASTTEDIDISFAKPMNEASVLSSNISIVGLVGQAPDFTITPTLVNSGVSKIRLTFDAPLTSDNQYTITINDSLTDIIGQPMVVNTAKFTTPAPEHIYDWGSGVQLYKGNGEDKTPIEKLEKGPITVGITATNNGMAVRPVTLVSALYKGDKLVSFDYSVHQLKGLETLQITTEINVSDISPDLKLQVMIWKDINNPYPLLDMIEKQ